jgi:hypothetical protein
MTLTAAPSRLHAADDGARALFEEARRRRRRRNLLRGIAAVALFAVVGVWAITKGEGRVRHHLHARVTARHPAPTSTSLAPCAADSLVATIADGQGGPVQQLSATLLTLTNKSGTACEIRTFPVLQLVGSAGMRVTAPPPGEVHVDLDMQPGPSGAKVANLYWQNWCAGNARPLTLHVILANGRGALTSPYGNASTPLPACTNSSQPTWLIETGGLDSDSLFGTGH